MLARRSQRQMSALVVVFIVSAVFVDYAAAQGSCTTVNRRQGVCVPVLECKFIQRLLTMAPRPLPPSVTQYIQRSHCGFFNNQHHACCDADQFSGGNRVTEKPTTVTPPTQASAGGTFEDASVKRRASVEPTDSLSKIGMNMLESLSCGKSGDDRVANGEDANLSEYPWMALLVYDDGVTKTLECGGSLITEQHVLTAAHCIVVSPRKKLIAARLGEHDTQRDVDCVVIRNRQKCAPPIQEIEIAEAIYHRDYKPSRFSDDIGLLRLQTKAVLRSNVVPVCLPIKSTAKTLPSQLVVAGWGRIETGLKASVLQKATVPIVDNDSCQKIHKVIRLSDKQLCAGGENRIDACKGDSGGPLFQPARYGRGARIVQYGIVSAGSTTCGSNFPGIYVRVEAYLPWITSNIAV